MKLLACLLLTFFAGAAGSVEFSAGAPTRDAACSKAKSMAGEAGYMSGECDCDHIGSTQQCGVESIGPQKAGASANPYSSVATASATTEARACNLAREIFPEEDRSPQACNCRSFKEGTLFACKALGRMNGQSGDAITLGKKMLIEMMKELNKCDPATDQRHCERVYDGKSRGPKMGIKG